MNVDRCWGIFREPAHSPGRESDDAEILRLTAKELEARGFEVAVKDPAEIGHLAEHRPGALFLMCEQVPVLRLLQEWEAGGVRLVNAPLAILNTYRECSLALLRSAGIPLPVSRVVPTAGRSSGDREPSGPLWVKRADVHNTQADDVVCVQSAAALRNALAGLARRGIARAVLQNHIEGDLVKFYGVGTTAGPSGTEPWFRQFYHRDQDLRGYPFDPRVLAQVARCAAITLGLEVFGGDAIVTPNGHITLIDLNAWPSFALYRDEAAGEIGRYLVRRFRPG